MSLIAQTPAAAAQTTTQSASTTQTLSVTPITVGNRLFVTGTYSDTTARTITSVSDSVDGTWTLIQKANNGLIGCFIAWIKPTTTAARTVTITLSGATSVSISFRIDEHSGTVATGTLDQQALDQGANPLTSTSITAGSSSPFVIGVAVSNATVDNAWTSPTTGWTQAWEVQDSSNFIVGRSVFQYAGNSGPFAPVWTYPGATVNDAAIVLTFIGSAAVPIGKSLFVPLIHPGRGPFVKPSFGFIATKKSSAPVAVVSSTTTTITPSGGMVFGGSVSIIHTEKIIPAGGMVLGGSSVVKHTEVIIPVGGMVLGGTSAFKHIELIVPVGGMILGGIGVVKHVDVIVPIGGGVIFGGVSAAKHIDVIVPTGGMIFGGTVSLIHTQKIVPVGGIIIGGAAGITFVPAGGSVVVDIYRLKLSYHYRKPFISKTF